MNQDPIQTTACDEQVPNFYDGHRHAVGDSVGYLMHQIVMGMRREIEQGMTEYGLTAAQWLPLWKLKLGQAHTAQELANQVGVDAGSMTRLLDRLEAKGLIERLRSSTDRRVVELSLTDAGEAAISNVPFVLADVNNKHLRGFTVDEWKELTRMLRLMLANSAGPPGQQDPQA